MKRFLVIAIILLSALPVSGQRSRAYRVGDIPNVHLSDARRFVSNPDGVLSESAVYRIDTLLYSLKQSGRAEVVVVAVNSIGNADPKDFIFRLVDSGSGGWGVGREDDNGLGILLVIDQGAIEIQTGYGLEGDLPDAILKRVINNYMLPPFREQNWDEGMIAGVNVIGEILAGRPPQDLEDDGLPGWVLVLLLFGFPMFLIIIVAIFGNRCPRCHRRKWKRTSTVIISQTKYGKVEENTYVCQHCGYVMKKKKDISNNIGGGLGGGMVIGGMGSGSRGGFGGGGFGGGSFGGGSFGGGGAGGRF